jgi:radical SAM protein with 4Fe4S-binding SPASM domain
MVFLSLDGLESTHDVIRRREGSYQRVLRAASLLRREGVPFGFITTVLRRNIGDLRKLAKLVEEQSAQIWSVWLGMSRVEGFGSDMWLSPHESKALLRKLGSLKKSCPPLVAGDNLGSFVCSSHLREASTQPMHGAGAGRFLQCEAGREMLGVRSDGSITGCLSLPSSQDVGSLTEEPLDALWRRAVSARRRRLSRRSGQCLECRFGAQCGAGCHGAALQRGGRVENPYCPIDDRSRSASPRRSVATKAASLLAATTIAAGWGGACTNRPPKSESAARSHGRGEPPGPGPGGVDEKRKKHRSATEEKATWDTEAPAEEHHPVAPTRKKRGRTSPIGSMPSCCMAHVLRPDCRCGGTGLMPSPRPRARPRPRPRPRKPPKP